MEQAYIRSGNKLPDNYKNLKKVYDKRLFFCSQMGVNKSFSNELKEILNFKKNSKTKDKEKKENEQMEQEEKKMKEYKENEQMGKEEIEMKEFKEKEKEKKENEQMGKEEKEMKEKENEKKENEQMGKEEKEMKEKENEKKENEQMGKEEKEISNSLVIKDDETKIDIREEEEEYNFDIPENESFEEFTKRINKMFSKFKYDKQVIKNMCDIPQSNSDRIVKFTPSQNFISHYFVPQNVNAKGLLVWHSVGTGKTCTAVATKSRTWDKENYTVLWVTRTTLRADIWKNMFDKVCDYTIMEKLKKGIKIPTGTDGKKYLTKNFMPPISFAQFSNICKVILGTKNKPKQQSSIYHRLVKRNGEKDPLSKTLIIIDEAHKLLAKDLIGQEKPDYDSIHKAIQESYEKSDKESCRPLLMTATPIMDDPMDYVKLLNLILTKKEQMPVTTDKFFDEFPVDQNFDFEKDSAKKFSSLLKGKISYLNRSYDPTSFAQPTFHNIDTEISRESVTQKDYDDLDKEFDNLLQMCEENYKMGKEEELNNFNKINEEQDNIDDISTEIENNTKEMREELIQAYPEEKQYIREKYTKKRKQMIEDRYEHRVTLKKHIKKLNNIQTENKIEYNKCKDSANKFKKDGLKRLKEKKKQDGELTQETVLKDKCKVDPLEL